MLCRRSPTSPVLFNKPSAKDFPKSLLVRVTQDHAGLGVPPRHQQAAVKPTVPRGAALVNGRRGDSSVCTAWAQDPRTGLSVSGGKRRAALCQVTQAKTEQNPVFQLTPLHEQAKLSSPERLLFKVSPRRASPLQPPPVPPSNAEHLAHIPLLARFPPLLFQFQDASLSEQTS